MQGAGLPIGSNLGLTDTPYMWTGDRTTNAMISGRPALPPEP